MAMNNRVLSIEIGNSFTKICEMDYKVKKPKVYKVLTVETPEGIVVDGMLQPTQEYADHLVNALGTNGIRTKKVLFTISSTRVASREVQIPNVKASKIEALVKTNANEYFPVDLTQYEIGHYLAGGLTENGKLRVMALAVPKALLDSYYQLAQMCGWEVECFDYSSNSLYQILRDEKSEKVTMVIKIDENSTIVTVLSAGKVLLQRTVAYGVQDAIDTMIASGAYAVNDPMSAVERFQKKTCLNRVLHQGDKVWEENAGRWEDEDAGNVEVTEARQKITASLEPLIVGVSRVIDFYDSRNSENPIEKSYVTGLGGSFSGMSKLFTNCLERKVHTLSEMDDKIGMSKAILGGTLTSQSDGAASTNALGRVHDRVRRDLTISDAMQIASTLSRQLLAPLAVLNCGVSDPRLLPWFRFDTREAEDIATFAQALPALASVMKISARWAHDKLKIPEAENENDILGAWRA